MRINKGVIKSLAIGAVSLGLLGIGGAVSTNNIDNFNNTNVHADAEQYVHTWKGAKDYMWILNHGLDGQDNSDPKSKEIISRADPKTNVLHTDGTTVDQGIQHILAVDNAPESPTNSPGTDYNYVPKRYVREHDHYYNSLKHKKHYSKKHFSKRNSNKRALKCGKSYKKINVKKTHSKNKSKRYKYTKRSHKRYNSKRAKRHSFRRK